MIFITLGTQKFQFNRLLKKIDELISEKKIKEKVFAQIGNSDYKPINFKYKEFLNKEEFEECVKKADLIITHAGVGTIITALNFDKHVIVVPRLAKYKEHVDDHQVEIAESFSKKGFVLSSGENIESLYENIKKSKTMKFKKYISSNEKINNVIDEFITKNNKIRVLMCCSDFSVKGGMVSVAKNYVNYKNWKKTEIIYIPTHIDGNVIKKVIFFLFAYVKIFILCFFSKFDIAHLHVAERGSMKRKLMIMKTCHFFKKKVIMHHHGGFFDNEYEKMNYKDKEKIRKMLESADLNIVLSQSLINSLKEKAPNSKVDYLYNAVYIYSSNLYNLNAKNILFLGKICKEKGIYDLLDAIAKIDKVLDKNTKLYICGEESDTNVRNYIKKLGIENRIKKIGWINNQEKQQVFSDCYVNVLPSYYERLPMTILESMSYGIPSITTNIASIPEVIQNEYNGFLIKPGEVDKLGELLLKKKEINKVSKNAYNTIKEKFQMKYNVEKLEKLYEKVYGVTK